MYNILITAGGTSEPIDNVRSITNTGTGRLGSLTADSFAGRRDGGTVGDIFYICSENAVRPQSDGISLVEIKTVADLQSAVNRILGEHRIDAVIHSMAVSDYTVDAVSSAEKVTDYLQNNPGGDLETMIQTALRRTDVTAGSGKISSGLGAPLILLKPTPKILPTFREHLPDSVIVGFKLLSGTTERQLIDTAFRLLQNNHCDFVLANDASQVGAERHTGHLLDREGNFTTFYTKREIAEGIADTVLKELKRRI